jgi:Arc/MetJ-type ribon-helix-helix transcriptional regulator
MFEKDFFKNASEFLKKFVLKAQKYKTTEKDAKRLLQEEVKKNCTATGTLGAL